MSNFLGVTSFYQGLFYTLSVLRIIVHFDTHYNENKQLRRGDTMIVIDYQDRRPLYEQIAQRFQELILRESWKRGNRCPPYASWLWIYR